MALVYIVEDDKYIREIETFSLKNSGYETLDFEYAEEFLKAVNDKKPDLVLLDIMLPDLDGLSVVKKLRMSPETKRIPIILVTAKTTEIDKVKGLDVGADDYLSKPFGVMELISRVKALIRRSSDDFDGAVISEGNIELDNEKRIVKVDGKICELTYKEFELLKMFMKNVDNVLSRDILLDRIWGIDFEGESRTLDMHIKTLRQKLGESGNSIKTIRNVGYRLEKTN